LKKSNLYVYIFIKVEKGGHDTSTHKRIGRTRYPNLILKKGTNGNNELINWFQSNKNGKLERKTLAVIQMYPSGVEIYWNILV
jgi:phage tail-like protein